MLSDTYLPIALFAVLALAVPALVFWLSRYFRPIQVDECQKTTYECGEEPIGEAQIQFHFQYYMFAIIFVAFDLVSIFIILWTLVFSDIGEIAKAMVVTFLAILMLGVTYALKKEETLWI
ncbi:MAG: NADH-quinone oxidoreductase subunit A [Thermoplasmata archaeon]|nr:NADH-quinone oxidoreductase subunit A [Thermoplasmata archaeon]